MNRNLTVSFYFKKKDISYTHCHKAKIKASKFELMLKGNDLGDFLWCQATLSISCNSACFGNNGYSVEADIVMKSSIWTIFYSLRRQILNHEYVFDQESLIVKRLWVYVCAWQPNFYLLHLDQR